MEGIQDAYEQESSDPALLPENCLDDSNRQIFLLPKEMMDFWPSLINEHEPNMDGTGMYSEAMSLEQMLEVFDEMKKFMALTLTIQLSSLDFSSNNLQAKQTFDSLFHKNKKD